jgi:hypothetical protein
MTRAAADEATVCKVVNDAVRQVQLRGYDLDQRPAVVEADGLWKIDHHLVYPTGWPDPRGPVDDPRMKVVLHLSSTQDRTGATHVAGRSAESYWISFSELT